MACPLSVLLVESRSTDAEIIRLLLARSPHGEFPLEHVVSLQELALEAIRNGAQESLSKEHIIGHLLVRVIRHSIAL